MNFFVCITTCQKNLPKLDILRNTWIKDLQQHNITYKFFIGRPTVLISNNDIVALDIDDNYESLRDKSIKAFEYCLDNYNFDYLVKVDDDTFVDVDGTLKLDLRADYIGWFSTLENHKKFINTYINYMKNRALRKNLNHHYFTKIKKDFPYAVGAYYILKRDALTKIVLEANKDDIFNDILQEDIGIGYLCDRLNISKQDIFYKMPWYEVSPNLFFHPVNSIIFNDLYKNKEFSARKQILQDKILLNSFYRFNLNE